MTEQEAQAVTGRWLDEAGVAPGMRVLDVGCGPGAVTELLLARVGPEGRVVGIDRAPTLLAIAAARNPDPRASFVEADLEVGLLDLGTFDAVIGRRVLMYLRDPAATLARMAERVRPGGLVLFQELAIDMAPSGLPLHDALRDALVAMLAHESASWTLGRALPGVFLRAGLGAPVMRAEIGVAAPRQPDTLAARVAMMQDRLAAAGAPEDLLDTDTLAFRLHAEREEAGLAWMAEASVVAWARVAGAHPDVMTGRAAL
jgi:SAM-dependent methyltransferase